MPELLWTACLWQGDEKTLTSSIPCHWCHHLNPWVFGRLYLYRLATALQPPVRELHPKKEHEFRLASSLHVFYLLPLALCSEQAGLSPSQEEQPCSLIEFHQNPGHLHSDKAKRHCFCEACL